MSAVNVARLIAAIPLTAVILLVIALISNEPVDCEDDVEQEKYLREYSERVRQKEREKAERKRQRQRAKAERIRRKRLEKEERDAGWRRS